MCGKGVDAAVLTGQVRQSLRTTALVSDDPAHTLDLVNQTLLGAGGSTFVTVAFGLLAERPGGGIAATMALGGHPPGLLLHDGTVTQVGAGGTLVGMLDTAAFHAVEFTLEPGDALVLYTDGATEARGPDGLLGLGPLIAELADCAGRPAGAHRCRAPDAAGDGTSRRLAARRRRVPRPARDGMISAARG